MRKKLCCVLMMTLLLTGCGRGGENKAEEMALQARGEYLVMTHCSGSAKITADYGQRVYRYELEFTASGKETVLTLTAPETVAGITARLSGKETLLEYDRAVLETGALDESGLTPVSAIPVILTTIRDGYLDTCTLEQDGEEERLRLLIRDPEEEPGKGMETTLWFDAATRQLCRAEISRDGFCVIQCDFSSFTTENSVNSGELK